MDRRLPLAFCACTVLGCAVKSAEPGLATKAVSELSGVPAERLQREQERAKSFDTMTLMGTRQSESRCTVPQYPASEVFGYLAEMIQKKGNPTDGQYSVTWTSTIEPPPPDALWTEDWSVAMKTASRTLSVNVRSWDRHSFSIEQTYSNVTPELVEKLAKSALTFDDLERNGCTLNQKIAGTVPGAPPP